MQVTTNNTILKVENLSKQYRLGLVGTGTLGDDLKRWWYRIRGKEDPFLKVGAVNDRTKAGESDYVWALQDINFEVKQGEVLGIIGKNGAGKSTLLKLLSRITLPTTGEIKTRGRIASLLEVGTGFHPELTGLENIYLNGAILGMTKAEIKAKEDEIVEFSGCKLYIDTPVKRYSSGMRVRLAFAVAAFLEPDILVIDEVLAVGDAEFQKKAIGKMQDISNSEGRTVLFVSHNMAAVQSLCTRAIVIENGVIVFEGKTDECVDHYLNLDNNETITNHRTFNNNKEFELEDISILEIGLRPIRKTYQDHLKMDDQFEMVIKYFKKEKDCRIDTTVNIKNSSGELLINFSTVRIDKLINENEKGEFVHILKFPKEFFNTQSFYVNLIFLKNKIEPLFNLQDVISFTIMPKEFDVDGWRHLGKVPLRANFEWDVRILKVNE